MDLVSRSLRVESHRSSINGANLRRSNSSLLASELISSQISRFTPYEKLSGDDSPSRGRTTAWSVVAGLFNLNKLSGVSSRRRRQFTAEDKTKTNNNSHKTTTTTTTRSKWLPDPNRRWPVQGW